MDSSQITPSTAAPSEEIQSSVDNNSHVRRTFRAIAQFPFRGMGASVFSRSTASLALAGLLVAIMLPPVGIGYDMCGMHRTMGLPCPGCGLTRSVTSFIHGDFLWSFGYHPLGFFVALIFLLVGPTLFFPNKWREKLIAKISRYDRHIGWGLVLYSIGIVVYGFVRIYLVSHGHPDYVWWSEHGTLPPFVQP